MGASLPLPTRRDARKRWLELVSDLHVHTRRDERSVHKPLLTLMLIARASVGCDNVLAFREAEVSLETLLREFGPPRKRHHPNYPFWHLQHDSFWRVREAEAFEVARPGNGPTSGALRARDAVGEVPEALWLTLRRDRTLQRDLVRSILDNYWPTSLHGSILSALGLPGEPSSTAEGRGRPRSPLFREEVLQAYQRRCAVCGFDGRLGLDAFGLDAAHIRWFCYEGPDSLDNGLALCSLHHEAFDRGAISLYVERNREYRVCVSLDLLGGEAANRFLDHYHGRPLLGPQSGLPKPSEEYVQWHFKWVFRQPARGGGAPILSSLAGD